MAYTMILYARQLELPLRELRRNISACPSLATDKAEGLLRDVDRVSDAVSALFVLPGQAAIILTPDEVAKLRLMTDMVKNSHDGPHPSWKVAVPGAPPSNTIVVDLLKLSKEVDELITANSRMVVALSRRRADTPGPSSADPAK